MLELCAGTLTDYCEGRYKGPELPPDRAVLYQIANGLRYIHSRKLVHRDVKPDNILISMTTPVQMKLSDFGFVKKTSPQGIYTQSGLKGTLIWMAPEILELLNHSRDSTPSKEIPHGSIQCDTFAAGCVFFYFLTRGTHPFGNYFTIPLNIVNRNPTELHKHTKSQYYICICITVFSAVWAAQHLSFITDLKGDDRAICELIGKMVKPKEQRIALLEVIIQMTTNLTATRKSNICYDILNQSSIL